MIGAPPLPQVGATTAVQARKLKLSSIIDPTLDAEIQYLTQAEVADMYKKYSQRYGDHPSPDTEPTVDQLSGLAQLLKTQSLPYVDMSIFGPYGRRALRRAVFTSYSLNAATGEWTKAEAPGPDCLATWEQSYKTYKVAMLLLEAADSERLEAYCDHIRDMHQQFGSDAWGIICRADVRMRSEFQDRIRRTLSEAPAYGYTHAAPWSAVYAASIKQSEFWAKEVATPATLLLARNKALPANPGDSSPEPVQTTSPKKGKKRKYEGEDLSKWDSAQGCYSHNRKGIQICKNFNPAKCGNGRPQSRCANNRSHQCNLCLGPHMATQCPGKRQG